MRRIRISAGDTSATATLADNATADAVWEALPITGRGNRWGAEIYFDIPVQVPLAPDARDVVEAGELGYWPPGSAFCIFWGQTPASRGDEIRAASPVNVLGRLEGDPQVFDPVSSGTEIRLEAA
jgi:hypothetical protein